MDEPRLLPVDGSGTETSPAVYHTQAHLAACHFRSERTYATVRAD